MTVPYDNFGKGSWPRQRDTQKYADNYDRIFRKKPANDDAECPSPAEEGQCPDEAPQIREHSE